MNDIKEGLEKGKEKAKEIVEKTKSKRAKRDKVKPIVVCRPLFISVLHIILTVFLAIGYVGGAYLCFNGDLDSMYYSFWACFRGFIVFNICFVILYFLINWIYRCIAKTMVALIDGEVYIVMFHPFGKMEKSIPLEKITGVSATRFLWIFRGIIIHQYMQVPFIFPTWNAKEFKDTVNEMITKDKGEPENNAKINNIIGKENLKYYLYGICAVLCIVALVGVVRFFKYTAIQNRVKSVPGTYVYEKSEIELNKDFSCTYPKLSSWDSVDSCSWEFDSEDNIVRVNYEYTYTSGYYYKRTYTDNDYVSFNYDKDAKTLTSVSDSEEVYTKKK